MDPRDLPNLKEKDNSWKERVQVAQVGISPSSGSYEFPRGWCLQIPLLPPYNVNLKGKITNYFTSKMNLFRNGRGIAVQDKQAMASHG